MGRWYQTGLPFRDACPIFHTVDLARMASVRDPDGNKIFLGQPA